MASGIYKTIGENLKEARQRKDLDQADVAKFLGVNPVTYTQYELAKRRVPIDVFLKISKFLEVSPWILLGVSGMEELDNEETQLLELWRSLPKGTARQFVLTLLESWSVQARSVNGW